MTVRLLPRRFLTSFVATNGEVRELKDPRGHPTARQLVKLHRIGALAIVEPGQVVPVNRGEAAAAISLLATPGGEGVRRERRALRSRSLSPYLSPGGKKRHD